MPVLIQCSRLVNIAVGVFMVLGGISNFFTGTWSSFILGAYAVVFGLGRSRRNLELTAPIVSANIILVVGGLEFLPHVPDYAYRYASFLFSFLGRGVCKLDLCMSADPRGNSVANHLRQQSTSLSVLSCCTTTCCASLMVR